MKELRQTVIHNAALVRQLLGQWHSTLDPPQGWKVAFLLHRSGIGVVGVSTWGRPVGRLEDQTHTMEHTRMALGPETPKNSASWFLARNREWIRANRPEVERVISYVDEQFHTGVTYRADNWRTVYSRQLHHSTWANRRGHDGSHAVIRTKFERTP